MQFKTKLAAIALAAAIAVPAVALAHDGANLNVPADQWLSPQQVTEKLTQKGYKVTEIETDDGTYEVDLIDKNGTHMDVHVHPATAEILVGYDD